MKEITLALGGGGVKGHAHIGVIRVLERAGYRVRAIAGTSAGGLWGSFFAAGYTADQIEEQMVKVDFSRLYTRRNDDLPSMLGVSGIQELMLSVLGGITFEELPVPFAVTAVDLETAQPVILRSGHLVDAVLASIAVPGVFPPRMLDGRLLVDGGVLDPVPVGLARSLAPDVPVVAVVLSPPLENWVQPQHPRLLSSMPFLSSYIARLRIARAFNIFLRSVDIGGAMLTELRLREDAPEVVVRPDVPHIGLLDTVSVPEVVRLGEEAAMRVLPQLEVVTGKDGWLSRRIVPLANWFSRRGWGSGKLPGDQDA